MPRLKEHKSRAAQVILANYRDILSARHSAPGKRRPRRAEFQALVDTSRARLFIPERIAAQLDLPSAGEAKVRDSRGRTVIRKMVKDVWLQLQQRDGVYTAIVEPDGAEPVIGFIVLADLDLIVDSSNAVRQRDPRGIVSEIE